MEGEHADAGGTHALGCVSAYLKNEAEESRIAKGLKGIEGCHGTHYNPRPWKPTSLIALATVAVLLLSMLLR